MVNWRAAGTEVRVYAAAREELSSLAITVYIVEGANQSALSTAIKAAIIAYMDSLGPNDRMYLAQVESRAIRVSDDVLSADVTTPASDTDPSASNYALRVLEADIAITFVEVS